MPRAKAGVRALGAYGGLVDRSCILTSRILHCGLPLGRCRVSRSCCRAVPSVSVLPKLLARSCVEVSLKITAMLVVACDDQHRSCLVIQLTVHSVDRSRRASIIQIGVSSICLSSETRHLLKLLTNFHLQLTVSFTVIPYIPIAEPREIQIGVFHSQLCFRPGVFFG